MAELRPVLIARRKILGLSQYDVAAIMGTRQSALSELETGNTVAPTIDTLTRWAAAVRVTLTLRLEFEEVVIPASTQTVPAPTKDTVV